MPAKAGALVTTVTTSGGTDINPTKSQLKSAKTPTYNKKYQSMIGSISKAYNLDIYHYVAPETGYYVVYTAGSLDTVGAVFEQNGLFSNQFDKIANNDEGYYLNYGYYNCKMVVHMDKGEDYFICIRGFNNHTGSYSLSIQPNMDYILSTTGGHWHGLNGSGSLSSTILGNILLDKYYLTKEQALFTYLVALDYEGSLHLNLANGSTVDYKYLKQLMTTDKTGVVTIANSILGIAIGYSTPTVIWIPYSIITCIIDLVPEHETKINEIFNNKSLSKIINEYCIISYNTTKPVSSTVSGTFTIKNGLRVECGYNNRAVSNNTGVSYNIAVPYTNYYTDNSTLLSGKEYEYGEWE